MYHLLNAIGEAVYTSPKADKGVKVILQLQQKPGNGLLLLINRRCGMENVAMKRIPPEKAMELLRKDGIEVTEEQAKVILEFLYEMADIVVAQYLSNPV